MGINNKNPSGGGKWRNKIGSKCVGDITKKKETEDLCRDAELQNKLKNICEEYSNGERDIPHFLKAIAYTIRYC